MKKLLTKPRMGVEQGMKPTRGGHRKGSGRKPKPPKEKAVSVCLSISQEANKRLRREAERKAVGIGKIANSLFLTLNAESLATRMTGDGCRFCNPELAAELKWNSDADEYNQWSSLGLDEKRDIIAAFISTNTDNP